MKSPMETPPRSVRVPDDLWAAAKEAAKQRGETVTDIIIRAMREYVAARRLDE